MGPQAAVGALTVRVYFVTAGSCHRPAMGITRWYANAQLEGLAPSTCIMVRVWDSCWWRGSWAAMGLGSGGNGEGEGSLLSANTNTLEWKLVKSAVVPCTCFGCCFLQWWKFRGSSAELVTGELRLLPVHGWYCSALLFSLVSSCLYITQLCWSLGGVKPKWSLPVVSQKAEEAGCLPHPPFPARGTLTSWKVPSGWPVLAWRMGWCRQHEAVLPSPFMRLFSGIFVPLFRWHFPGLLSSSRAVFVCG